MSILDSLIGKIAPHDCLSCGAEGNLLCNGCASHLPAAPVQTYRTGSLKRIQAATAYRGAAKDLVWKLKSGGAQSAAKLMVPSMIALLNDSRTALIVPIPTATSRVRQRGYNQARLLARELARQTRLPYAGCLVRSGQSHQVGASRTQRLEQLTGSFRITRPHLVRGAHLILVDDVTTTGATLEAAAAALRAAGAETVEAITFAQA